MSKTDNLPDFLTDLAEGIRAKKGTTNKINAQNMRSEIDSIETSEDLSAELNAQDVALTNLENYVNELPTGDEPDTTVEDGLLDGSLSGEYTNNRIKELRIDAISHTQITSFSSTSLEEIEGRCFFMCENLEYCNIPNLVKGTNNANIWYECKKLKRLDFPKLTSSFGSGVCRYCEALTYVNLGEASSISSYAFLDCTNLQYLVLPRTTNIVALSSIDAFKNSAIANGTGFVYVPDDLVETYKTATNWSTYADQIKPLSELPEGV